MWQWKSQGKHFPSDLRKQPCWPAKACLLKEKFSVFLRSLDKFQQLLHVIQQNEKITFTRNREPVRTHKVQLTPWRMTFQWLWHLTEIILKWPSPLTEKITFTLDYILHITTFNSPFPVKNYRWPSFILDVIKCCDHPKWYEKLLQKVGTPIGDLMSDFGYQLRSILQSEVSLWYLQEEWLRHTCCVTQEHSCMQWCKGWTDVGGLCGHEYMCWCMYTF